MKKAKGLKPIDVKQVWVGSDRDVIKLMAITKKGEDKGNDGRGKK